MADADSSEQEEVARVDNWHLASSSSTTPTTTASLAPVDPTDTNSTSMTILSGHQAGKSQNPLIDESTANGFTTAPATSEEDNLDYEEDSDDDDDSRSNYSNNHSSNNNNSTISNGRHHSKHNRLNLVKGEEKRSHHNVLERKRRDLLKDSFTKLRDSVPTTQPKERVSRAEILKQAADFIQSRVQSNARVRAELEELLKKNRELEEEKMLARGKEPPTATTSASSCGTSKTYMSVNRASELEIKQDH